MTWLADVRVAFRTLARTRTVAAVMAATVALVVLGNTTVFSVINGLMLRPLPFRHYERLVLFWQSRQELPDDRSPLSPANFQDYAQRVSAFEDVAAYRMLLVNLTGADEPEQLATLMVSPNLFRMLEARALLGTVFTDEQARPGAERTAVLTHGLWTRRFASAPDVVGRTIQLDGASYRVLGVMPERFEFLHAGVDLWLPYGLEAAPLDRAERSITLGLGLLRPGVTIEQARRQLGAVAADLATRYPEANRGYGARALTLRQTIPRDTHKVVFALLQCGALLVLLIACANIAGVLLLRTRARSGELALRLAVGARRGRLVRLLLTESVVLSVSGGLLGTAAAGAAVHVLRQGMASTVAYHFLPRIDARVLAFSFASSVAAGLAFGLLPALRGSQWSLIGRLKGGGAPSAAASRGRLQRALAVGQVALSFTLLCGAGFLLWTFLTLQHAPAGFEARDVLTFELTPPERDYDPARLGALHERLLEELRSVPGATAAACASTLPQSLGVQQSEVRFPQRGATDERAPVVTWLAVSPSYFEALRVPLLQGRGFDARDHAGAPEVVVVDRRFVERFGAGAPLVGSRVHLLGASREVIGVAADVAQERRGDSDSDAATVYLPWDQQRPRTMHVLVRSAESDPVALAPAVRQAVRRLDSRLPLSELMSLQEFVARQYVALRFLGTLVGALGVMALLLACLGLYGVLGGSVADRVGEFGLRAALGATRGDVLRMVLRDGLVLVAWGLLAGGPVVWVLRRAISSVLHDLAWETLAVVPAVALALVAVALVASALPALRAARLSPTQALRCE